MANNKKKIRPTIIPNKKATFSYTILDKYTAGIALLGTEIKSIRQHQANLTDAYCYFKEGSLWLKGLHISHYQPAGQINHDPVRIRRLLLTKHELRKLLKGQEEKGYAIIALQLFINSKGLAKIEIALAKGKKLHDKRAAIKSRDLDRSIQRNL
ncbi:MAG: SsrA-binding protein SmpB [Bacteroidota bacterium]